MTDGGVLVVRFSGPITSGAMLDALKRPIAAQLGAHSRAVLADYTAATLALPDEAIRLMMAGGESHNLPDLPAVVVADAETGAALCAAALHATINGGALRSISPSQAHGLRQLQRLHAPGCAWP
jgi:hypothetical protein